MDTQVTFITACVAIGFLMFGMVFWGFMQKWELAITWALCLVVSLFMTVIPVIIVLTHASSTSMQDAGQVISRQSANCPPSTRQFHNSKRRMWQPWTASRQSD